MTIQTQKNSLFGSKISRHHHISSSFNKSRPLSQSKSFTSLKELQNSYYQNYFRFEIKCGNTGFVYEKNINRSVSH